MMSPSSFMILLASLALVMTVTFLYKDINSPYLADAPTEKSRQHSKWESICHDGIRYFRAPGHGARGYTPKISPVDRMPEKCAP